ncbi:MAG TPA: polysaccharide biosynthesis/export family protein [Candidatus Binatia bacterium]|nr:polysaccharide biosynthesis/export family protein [Candidatus Binatia bacterium]
MNVRGTWTAMVAALALGLLATACGPHRNYAPFDTIATLEDERYDITQLPEYKLQVGDALSIKFYRNPELDQNVVIRPDGRISLLFLDDIKAAGLTPAQLDEEITRRFTGELAVPDIAVIVTELGGHNVFVDGEVFKPSMVKLSGGMTMLNAISSAGGFRPEAIREQVILIRRDKAGEPIGHAVDLKPVIFGRAPEGDVLLQPFDIVYVPRSKIANANLWVKQYIRDMLPINPGLSIPTQ